MRAQFVLSEMAIGLRRNLTMTIAVVVTVAISLALLGAGLLIRQQVQTMQEYWYDRIEVSIFLDSDVSAAQRETLNRDLVAAPEVSKVVYESKEEAYQRFTEQFSDSPDLVRNVSPDVLPESFRVKLTDPAQFEVVKARFETRPGVEEVHDQREVLDPFFRVLNGLQRAALFAALVQILAAALLVSNTIRLAAYSRRRETGIMRLVGASKSYIQLPFLLEGAVAGLLGALLASGTLILLKRFVLDGWLRPIFRSVSPLVGWDALALIIPALIVSGVALTALASFVTLRKYLRV